MRLSFVGELGWELHIPKDSCLPVYHAVMAAGAKHGIINSGYRAIDSLSIEKGNFQSAHMIDLLKFREKIKQLDSVILV